MLAIRQHRFGPPEVLRPEELPDPVPGPGQVRIAVASAGVHLLDTSIRAGRDGGAFPLPALPMVPGREAAGVVDAVGPGVDGGWEGRRVVAHLGQASGGYAQLALREVEALHVLPARVGFDAAVAMIGTGRTVMGVLEAAALRPGDVVLILGAAGGMGSLLVQAARAAGASVIGAAGSPRKLEHVRALGADVAVTYAGIPEAPAPTVVLDGVGGDAGGAAVRRLARGGRVLVYGWSSGTATPLDRAALAARGIAVIDGLPRLIMGRPGGIRALESAALGALAAGSLAPVVHPPFALAGAADAHAALESRATIGKVVLRPAGAPDPVVHGAG